jgi:hypothetical protein
VSPLTAVTSFKCLICDSLLAAYDLGAPAKLLQAIYNEEQKMQRPVDLGNKETTIENVNVSDITKENWQTFLGKDRCAYSMLTSV